MKTLSNMKGVMSPSELRALQQHKVPTSYKSEQRCSYSGYVSGNIDTDSFSNSLRSYAKAYNVSLNAQVKTRFFKSRIDYTISGTVSNVQAFKHAWNKRVDALND